MEPGINPTNPTSVGNCGKREQKLSGPAGSTPQVWGNLEEMAEDPLDAIGSTPQVWGNFFYFLRQVFRLQKAIKGIFFFTKAIIAII